MRALFTTSGGYGHFLPMLPIAQSLAARGQEVAFAVPASFTGVAEEAGFRAFPMPTPVPDAVGAKTSADGRATVARYLEQSVLTAPALSRTVEDWGADVIVRETTAWAGWLVGEGTGIPVAVFDFAPTPPVVLAATTGRDFQAARAACGLPPDPRLRTLNRWLHLLAAPPGWYEKPVFGETSHLFQPPPDPDAPEGTAAWRVGAGGGRPLVYVSLGTKFNATPGVLEAILEALADEEFDVVATTGASRPPSLLREAGNITVKEFIPQALIVPHADAVVCHAGYGTLMSALCSGRPAVAIPLGNADGPANGARLAATGAGITMSVQEATRETLRQAVQRVLTEREFRTSARTLADGARELPPLAKAAQLLERLARERRPILATS
ncbi:glycosyltransferase [Streptomyces sp. NPDC094038]|uniref:glycosyltransferase n=1 Tax=Streptomyces sp. NPDC094038 TaxID=3366055 RepID=UPI00381E8C83